MATKGRFSNPFSAVFTGVLDVLGTGVRNDRWSAVEDLSGLVCLVTGANSGLGLGISTLLVEKGAHVIMACRRAYKEALESVKEKSRSGKVEMRVVDLTDYTSILSFVNQLKADGVHIDVSIHNAGVTTPSAHKLSNGLDEMFMVNYLSKYILINALVESGIINSEITINKHQRNPRIILVSSDSHRGASQIELDEVGVFEEYKGPNRAVSLYGYNKLILNTYGVELARRMKDSKNHSVDVFIICPGPVNTNIIRHAPIFLRGILRIIFFLFFKAPIKAARPVVFLAGNSEMNGRNGVYWHMWNEKTMDEKCYNQETGVQLWEASQRLVTEMDY